MIESGTASIDMTIGYFENRFWRDDHKMSPESQTNVMNRFKQSLGRPIRTPTQIEADRQRKAEAFRRAEEAAQSGTNRPPPLILIDGDL